MTEMAGLRRAVVSTPSDHEIRIVREFDAPAALVFRAWTTPDIVARWWHAERGTVTSIDIDLRVGGQWRYVMVATAGFEVAFHGEFREIVPDQRLVTTEVYEGANRRSLDDDGVRRRRRPHARGDPRPACNGRRAGHASA